MARQACFLGDKTGISLAPRSHLWLPAIGASSSALFVALTPGMPRGFTLLLFLMPRFLFAEVAVALAFQFADVSGPARR